MTDDATPVPPDAPGAGGDDPTPPPGEAPTPPPDETTPPPDEAVTELGDDAPSASSNRTTTWPGDLKRLADRYQLEEPIASGGAAIVWRAFDEVLSRSVAIKLLHPHLATDPTTVERFRLESINAARLTHPNVVAIYDTGQQNDIVYLVMEYVDGPSLRDIVRERGQLEPSVVAALGEQVAAALGEAHNHGIVHRDVKPANIILTSDGVAKVTDFGIAKALSGNQVTLTSPGTVVGTAAYVAPEQLEGGRVDARADIYALGVVLYECLTGQPAWQGDTPTATAAARLTQELLAPRQVRADVPRALNDIVVRATRRDPDDRFVDGSALATAIAPLVRARPSEMTATLVTDVEGREVADSSDTDSSPPRISTVAVDRGQYGRRLALAFASGLLLAVAGFFAVQALRDEPRPPSPIPGVQRFEIERAGVFDPFGDGTEHNDQVDAATDSDLDTAWMTEAYRDPLTGVKPGVGLWFDLGEPVDVTEVVVDTDTPGMQLELYAADDLPEPAEGQLGWGNQLASVESELFTRIDVDAPARYWLVWIIDVPEGADGRYQGALAEVRFVQVQDET
ncbi:MAG: protein kinase [Nitriliruptorales bacterium]|nr:protein kinase [Nitriliruptorales bacterium]